MNAMPVHDWTRVDAGIFHDFHHGWIEEIKRALNSGLLPEDYYALAEQHAAGFGPDVLTLQETRNGPDADPQPRPSSGKSNLLLAPPKVRLTGETDMEFYHRKRNTVAVRHVSGDRIVAMVEVVSPGNKTSRNGLRSFVEKAAELLDKRVHLLILDLHPPGPRDPQGIHGEIWDEITGEEYIAPPDKPLTLAAYESALTVRYYVEPVAVGDILIDMPLFLEPGAHIDLPLEATYQAALAAVPRRWQRVLEAPSS
jgi:hypothetical protein